MLLVVAFLIILLVSMSAALTAFKRSLSPRQLSFAVLKAMSSGGPATDNTVIGRCTNKISTSLNPVKVVVTGHNDDPNGSHIQITCISNEFKGKTIVQRQRLIYKAIWDEMSGPTAPVHAVDSIVAKTPEEANM